MSQVVTTELKEDKRLERIGRKMEELLKEALRPYISVGRNVALFFEPEAQIIYLMDREHPAYIDSDKVGMLERQQAVIGRIPVNVPHFDAGAW